MSIARDMQVLLEGEEARNSSDVSTRMTHLLAEVSAMRAKKQELALKKQAMAAMKQPVSAEPAPVPVSAPAPSEPKKAAVVSKAQKDAEEDAAVKVGDIFASSWGYDQTNVDFYQVVKTTAKTLTLRQIEQKVVSGEGSPSEKVVPRPNKFLLNKKPLNRRLSKYGGVKIHDYENAYPWNGNPMHQTGAGYGH